MKTLGGGGEGRGGGGGAGRWRVVGWWAGPDYERHLQIMNINTV